jgi:hypothetical protein
MHFTKMGAPILKSDSDVGLENENVRNAICECVVDFLRETTATSE